MKKILFALVTLLLSASTTFAQKWSVDHFTVATDRVATVYLTNENGQLMVKNIRAIVNPTYDKYGRLTGGSLDNRGGLMLTPPIKPGLWEKDGSGNIVPVNFSHNSGCSSNTALVYIIEGYVQPNGSINFTGREEVLEFSYTFNPSDWVRRYPNGSYEIPNFCLPVQVTKDYGSSRYFGK